MYQEILYTVEDPVATITLNRPEKLNALTNRMLQELPHAVAAAEADEHVVGIVITGAGRGFCAGADMGGLQVIQAAGAISAGHQETEFAGAKPGDQTMGGGYSHGVLWLQTVRKPVIAAVNGVCAGMGFSLAMSCDLRFASERAAFITAYAQRGLVAEHGMSWVLPRLIGPARALDLLWSGRRVDAEEALALGLADRVVPPEQLPEQAAAYIRHLAATASPLSLMHMKRQVYRDLTQPFDAVIAETQRLMDETVAGPDFQEGIAAFLERRPPHFSRIS